jgi:hypothetical protein
MRSIAKRSLKYTGLFEAELLVELMLRFWKHPLAGDADFRHDLLESAAQALRAAVAGQQLIQGLPPEAMNLVSAIWYAEWSAVTNTMQGKPAEGKGRRKWLETIRRSLPSCFCDPKLFS